jgi:hypothetical protein
VQNELREHFDNVSITCSVYEADIDETHRYVKQKGHIGAIISDLKEHVACLEDMEGGNAPYEPSVSEEEND